MLQYFEKQKKRFFSFAMKHMQGRYMQHWLAFFSFTESIILPFPTAAFFIPVLMGSTKRWAYLAGLITLFSVLGGIAGYFIAVFFFDTIGIRIIEFYNLTEQLNEVRDSYNGNAFFINFIGAFTPLPYKLFVLASGFFGSSFVAFVIASILGRGLQFYLVGYFMNLFGAQMTRIFLKYFNVIVLILVVAFALSLIF